MTYTEDSLVEQPAIQLFAELGWETLSASDEVMGMCTRVIFRSHLDVAVSDPVNEGVTGYEAIEL